MSLYEDDSARVRVYLFRPHLQDVHVPRLEGGYCEVASREDLVPHWALLMHQVFGSSIEDPPLVKDERFNHDRVILVFHDEVAVGLCIGWYEPTRWPASGQIFFTAVHIDHRRRKIGEFVVTRLLERFRQEGFRNAIVSTETYRTPAICLYHKLGFLPLMTGEVDDEAERWHRAVQQSNKPDLLDNVWTDYSHLTKQASQLP